MAINYTDLFEDVGEFVEAVNIFRGWTTTELPAIETEINAQLTSNTRYDVLSGVPEQFEQYKDQVALWATDMSQKARTRLRHRETVLEQLGWQYSGQGEGISDENLLIILWADMEANTQTIDRSACSVGSVAAGSGNYGDAQVVLTLVLDGASSPGNGYPVNIFYKGETSELCQDAEVMRLTCASDSQTDGVTDGGESFRWDGNVPGNNEYDWRANGSGEGPSVSMANGSGLIANGEFEDFTTTDTPDSWTIVTGAATTTIFQETTAADVKRGDSALQFTGNGATATIEVEQDMSNRGLVPNKRYCVGVWVKGEAGILAGDLTIQFAGTGYTAGGTEKITMNAAALAAATSYTFKHFFVNMPEEIPTDFVLEIKVASTLTNTKNVWFDGMAMAAVEWHGGVGAAVFAGATPTLRNDIFSWTNTNDGAGVFQEFFRRFFKAQLRSSGTPSIADTLATD